MVKVAFQGEYGAYGQAAIDTFFKDSITYMPCATFADALDSTISKKSDYTILPVENSIEGSVGESYDLLYRTALHAVGEVYQRIEHCLIGTGGMQEVETVYSHPQALGQCRTFLQKHGIRTVPAYDTAGSVKIIADIGRKDTACIASQKAADHYGIPVIRREIADDADNYTRFLVLSGEENTGQADKTSIILSIKHEPGSLFRIISRFNEYNVNLTKIESRPKKTTLWEYNFYIDFEADAGQPDIREMLDAIKTDAAFFKVLGSYRRADP